MQLRSRDIAHLSEADQPGGAGPVPVAGPVPLAVHVPVAGPAPSAPRVRLVGTDLDGTLLDASSRVSRRAAAAVEAARVAGIHVVPVTGRPPQGLWRLAATGGLGPLGVCSNGAALVDLEAARVTDVHPFEAGSAGEIVRLAREAAPGVLLAFDDLDQFCYEPEFLPLGDPWDQRVREVADVSVHVEAVSCIKLIARLPGSEGVALMERLAERLGDRGHVTISGLDWVDIMAPGVSKATGLEVVCRRLAIEPAEVAVIGDNYNDLPALHWAGQALAPANAVAAVLDVVDRVLPPNVDDGVAAFLEELVDAPV